MPLANPLFVLAALCLLVAAAPALQAQEPTDCLPLPTAQPRLPLPNPTPTSANVDQTPGGAEPESLGPCATSVRRYALEAGEWVETEAAFGTYDAANRLVASGYDLASLADGPFTDVTYTYDEDGRLSNALTSEDGAPRSRTVYSYDDRGRHTQALVSDWEGSAWVPASRRLATYEHGPHATAYSYARWDGTSWQPQRRNAYSYDGDLLTVATDEAFTENGWVLKSRALLRYGETGELVESVQESYADGMVDQGRRYRYAWGDAGQLVARHDAAWREGAWADIARTDYTYQADGLLATRTLSLFVFGDVPYFRNLLTYRAGRLLLWVNERYEDGAWRVRSRSTYERDDQHRLVERLLEYDVDGTLTPYDSTVYAYAPPVASERDLLPVPSAFTAPYPNPTRYDAALPLHLAAPAAVRVRIYDALGREVAASDATRYGAGAHTLSLPTRRLATGTYLVRAEAGEASQVFPIAVVR